MADKVTIIQPESTERSNYIYKNSPNIRPTELTRLVNQMAGQAQYEPRQGGQGQKLRCKAGNCINWSLANGRKQLCPTHYATFLEKSNRALAIPKCSYCNSRTNRVFEGKQACVPCQADIEQKRAHQDSIEELYRRKQIQEASKMQQLDDAETITDLREWIKQYMS
jgi:hypothetical protein